MPSMAAVYRHTRPRLLQALSATLQKLRSQKTVQETHEIGNDSRVELRPVYHDRSNYEIIDKTDNYA